MQQSAPLAHRTASRPWIFDRIAHCSVDWITNALAWSLFLYITVDRSADRLLWSDEVLSAVLLRESFHKMLWGWWQGADGGGVFFYLIGWVWERIAGNSDMSLRMLSAIPLCCSFSLLWWVGRRFYRPFAMAVGGFVVYLGSEMVSWHLANARFYGLFLLACSLAMVVYLAALQRPSEISTKLLLASFLAHLLLTGTHILGALYSLAIIVALLLCDLRSGHRRWRLYLASAAGWLVLLPSIPAILNSARVGKQFFWTVPPTWEIFRAMVTLYSTTVEQALFASATIFASLWVVLRHNRHDDSPQSGIDSRPAMLLVVCLYAAAFLVFLKSCFGTSLAADRYVLPIALAAVLLLAELATRILNFSSLQILHRWPVELACIALTAAGLFFVALQSVPLTILYPARGYEARLLSQIPAGSTIVVPYDFSVYPAALYYGDRFHQRILFPVDHDATTWNTLGINLARRWNDAGIYSVHQPEVNLLFDGHSSFYLLLSSSGESWWDRHIKNNPHVTSTKQGSDEEFRPLTIWKIEQH